MNAIVLKARCHLVTVLGERAADKILADCSRESGVNEVATLEQVLKLGEVMLAKGGFVEVVGRFVRVQAIVAGVPPATASVYS